MIFALIKIDERCVLTEFYGEQGYLINNITLDLDRTHELFINNIVPPRKECDVILKPYLWFDKNLGFGVKWIIEQLHINSKPITDIDITPLDVYPQLYDKLLNSISPVNCMTGCGHVQYDYN